VVMDLDRTPSSELIQALAREPGFIRTRLLVK
jgi:D-3-phosphoglycerate dehydrogenase